MSLSLSLSHSCLSVLHFTFTSNVAEGITFVSAFCDRQDESVYAALFNGGEGGKNKLCQEWQRC